MVKTLSKPGNWSTVADVKAANESIGHHWFSPDTMRFFGTRIESGIIGGRYFITSEQPPHGARKFSVRVAHDDGRVSTVGDFCSYSTKGAARDAALAARHE